MKWTPVPSYIEKEEDDVDIAELVKAMEEKFRQRGRFWESGK